LATGLGLAGELGRVRPEIRRRIHIHYPEHLSEDGTFVWNYVFREGAITWGRAAQERQVQQLQEQVGARLRTTDYLVFVCDDETFIGGFSGLIEQSLLTAGEVGVQVIFLVIGAKRRPEFLAKRAPLSPTFYLGPTFGEKDLEPFRAYLVQDSIGGFKQR
jgi:hypothetical protein